MTRLFGRFVPGPERRFAILVGSGTVVTIAACRFALSGGTPDGILLQGALRGARQALLAAALVLVYRSTRVINFAQAVLGALGATAMFHLGAVGIENVGVAPFPVAFAVALVLSVGLAMLTELVFVRRFFKSPRLVLTVVTIVLIPTLVGLSPLVSNLPFWRRGLDAQRLRAAPSFPGLDSLRFRVEPLTFGLPDVLTVVSVLVILAGLGLFLVRTRFGAAVRGTSENPERALHLGINVPLLSTLVWGIAGLLSGLAAALATAAEGSIGSQVRPMSLLPPLAAVVLARLRSIPVAVITAVALGVVQQAVAWSFPETQIYELIVLAIVLGGLFLQRGAYSRSDQASAGSWKATQELPPMPRELAGVVGVRRARRALAFVAVVAVLVFPQAYSTAQANQASLIAIYVLVALSLVALTGWGGQISLGQFALVAVGALIGGKLTGDLHLSFWLALPVSAALTAGFATVVGLPALRVRGPFLAVATLAFAAGIYSAVKTGALDFLIATDVERPRLLFISLSSERAYYYVCVAFAALAAIVVRRLRAGRPGRVMIAIREDEYGVQTFGVNAGRSRLAVFALAGALAGIAGVLWIHHQRSFELEQFQPEASIDIFIMAMIGGITSVSGAVLGAVYIGATRFLIADPPIQRLAQGSGLLLLLMIAPGGLSQLVYAARDSVLRIVALRQRIPVPSLFGDVDPEAILNRKATFAPMSEGRGLASLPVEQRYAAHSDIYPGADERVPTGVGGGSR